MLLILIIILLIYLFLSKKCFNISNIDNFESTNTKSCCLMKKEYAFSKDGLYKGYFKYNYTKLKDNDCDYNKHIQNSNQQLFIDGENGWDNNMCDNNNTDVGSCRRGNRECVDFLKKKDCDKYYMDYSNNTCHNAIPFVFSDTIIKPPSLMNINPHLLTYNNLNNHASLNDIFKVNQDQIDNITSQYTIKNNEAIQMIA
jgi:hypothetical protein